MISKNITIINKLGLHARAAAKLVQLASRFDCEFYVAIDGRQVNGKSIMGVMMLAASKGTEIQIIVDGADESEAMNEIESLINQKFGENE